MSDSIVVIRDPVREVVEVVSPGPSGPPGKDGDPTPVVAAHNADTTAVHGIADTAQLVTDADLAAEKTGREAADAELTETAEEALSTADAALPKAGGTLTGPLQLHADPVTNLQAVTRQFVMAQIAALIDGAPGTRDTLGEIAAQLATDEGAVEALSAAIAGALRADENLADLLDVVEAKANLGLGSAANHAATDFDLAGAAAAAAAASQPLDTDLTQIAASNTTAIGRSLLAAADAGALRTLIGAAAAAHTHAMGDITGLVEALAAKVAKTELPTVAALAANVTAKESTELKDVSELAFAIGSSATEVWQVYCDLLVTGSSAGDLLVGFSLPAGATGVWGATGRPNAGSGLPVWGGEVAGTTPNSLKTLEESSTFGLNSTGTMGIPLKIFVFGGGSAGTVKLRMAQGTSNATATALLRGSCLEARKVAS